MSSCSRPSLTVRSKDTFEGRGVSKDADIGTWCGKRSVEGAILNDVRAAAI